MYACRLACREMIVGRHLWCALQEIIRSKSSLPKGTSSMQVLEAMVIGRSCTQRLLTATQGSGRRVGHQLIGLQRRQISGGSPSARVRRTVSSLSKTITIGVPAPGSLAGTTYVKPWRS